MKLVFMGNGPFAVPTLEALHASKHELLAVICRPDRPTGKSQAIVPGPTHQAAKSLGVPVYQPESINSEDAIAQVRAMSADLSVVADYGQILSPDAISATRLGGINVHASLLPKYRGAAPVVWAIYHGEKETGVSIIRLANTLDGGDVLAQARESIKPDDTSATLEPRLAQLGAGLALTVVNQLADGSAKGFVQDRSKVTKAPKLKKEDGLIDWSRSAEQILHQIHAMIPWPIAYTAHQNAKGQVTRWQVLQAEVTSGINQSTEPGTVVSVEKSGVGVQTGSGILLIKVIKPAGKKEMPVGDYMRGNPVTPGDKFVAG